jgi:hypothetical protein
MGDILTRATPEAAHRASVEVTDMDLVEALVSKLGTRLVCFVVDKDKSTLSRWKQGSIPVPLEASQRLRSIYQVFRLLESSEADHTIRAWFIGMNPQLDDTSPIEAVKGGQHREVMAAARAFLAGG